MDAAIEKKHVSLYTTLLACLCYCYFIVSRIPKGFFRLFSVLPVFYIFAILLQIPSIVIHTTSALLVTSLANFQLSLFDSSNHASSKPRRPKKSPVLGYLALEILVLAAISISYSEDKFPPCILLVFDCCQALLAVDFFGSAVNFILHATVGLELEQPSDKPYLSTSLQNFWGRRWNLSVTDFLRRTVYKPVRSASAVLLGNRLAQFAAVLATFLVSGLLHEIFFYFLTFAEPNWEMTSFFVLHGFCVAVEVAIKKGLNGRWGLPGFVSVPLTIGFVMLTGFWLFFPPLMKSGLYTIVREEFKAFVELVKNEVSINFGGHQVVKM